MEELASLRHRRKRLRLAAVVWLVATPIWPLLGLAFGFFVWLIESVVTNSNWLSQGVLFLSAVIGLFFGVSVSILKAKDCFHYAAVLSRTIRQGFVRQFVGEFDHRFWTTEQTLNQLLRKLVNKKLIDPATTEPLEIEVYPQDEYVYRLNQNCLNGFFLIYLTAAATNPQNPARFRAPTEFQFENEERVVERRRLTTEEQEELRGYARQTRRRGLIYSPILLWIATQVAWFLSRKFLSFDTSRYVTGIALVTVAAVLFFRFSNWANAYKQDAESGWVIIVVYLPEDFSEPGFGDQSVTVEYLINTGNEWTIDGKPASWRKRVAA